MIIAQRGQSQVNRNAATTKVYVPGEDSAMDGNSILEASYPASPPENIGQQRHYDTRDAPSTTSAESEIGTRPKGGSQGAVSQPLRV